MGLFIKIIFDMLMEVVRARMFGATSLIPGMRESTSMRPRRGFFAGIYEWLVWSGRTAVWGMVMAFLLKMMTLWDVANEAANASYADALKGTDNGRCVGELAVAQRATCDKYDAILSRWHITRVRIALADLLPSCLFMECTEIWTSATNSYFAWLLWAILILVIVVWVVQLGARVLRKLTGITTHARIVAVNQDQEYYRRSLPAPVRYMIEDQSHINAYAARHTGMHKRNQSL